MRGRKKKKAKERKEYTVRALRGMGIVLAFGNDSVFGAFIPCYS